MGFHTHILMYILEYVFKKKQQKKKQRNLKELSVFIFTGVLPIF